MPPVYVIHFIATNFVGGPEKQILSHLGELQAADFRLLLVSFAETGGFELRRQSTEMGIRCELLPAQRKAIWAVLRQLLRIYQTERPSVICAHGYKAVFYALLLKLLTGTKVISFSRGWTAENMMVKFYGWIDKLIIRFSDRIVAVSRSQQTRLRRVLVPARKIRVVHNAVTRSSRVADQVAARDIREELGLTPTAQVVLTAGRLSPEKGHADLLSAAVLVLGRRLPNEVHFVIAGNGPLDSSLRVEAARLGIANHVHFLGFRDDVRNLYRSATLFVLPSLSEGLPNVLLEALDASLPVVSTRVGGVPEMIDHGQSGLLVRAGRPAELAEQIVRVLTDPGLRARLQTNGLDLVRSRFSTERQSQLLLDVYREVANG